MEVIHSKDIKILGTCRVDSVPVDKVGQNQEENHSPYMRMEPNAVLTLNIFGKIKTEIVA